MVPAMKLMLSRTAPNLWRDSIAAGLTTPKWDLGEPETMAGLQGERISKRHADIEQTWAKVAAANMTWCSMSPTVAPPSTGRGAEVDSANTTVPGIAVAAALGLLCPTSAVAERQLSGIGVINNQMSAAYLCMFVSRGIPHCPNRGDSVSFHVMNPVPLARSLLTS